MVSQLLGSYLVIQSMSKYIAAKSRRIRIYYDIKRGLGLPHFKTYSFFFFFGEKTYSYYYDTILIMILIYQAYMTP